MKKSTKKSAKRSAKRPAKRSARSHAGTRKGYQGHSSWAAWNVSLWISNEEPLYRLAVGLKKDYGVQKGAEIMLQEFHYMGVDSTPDGAKYTKSNIAKAMRGL